MCPKAPGNYVFVYLVVVKEYVLLLREDRELGEDKCPRKAPNTHPTYMCVS